MENIKHHNFTLTRVDTDSIGFCKKDMSPFTEQETEDLVNELNQLYPDGISWDNDGIFPRMLVVKSKNYVMDDGNKVKFKGSSLTDQKKEKALIEYLHKMIHALLDDKSEQDLIDIYNSYIKEAHNIQDISRWCVKKTVTQSVLLSERLNEQKVRDAIGDKVVQEGDKIYIYPVIDGKKQYVAKGELQFLKNGEPKLVDNQILRLKEAWDGNVDTAHLVKRIYATTMILENVINIDNFCKYQLKGNRSKLEDLLNRE